MEILCFNGAAGDLGGLRAVGRTKKPSPCASFNGAADDLGGSTSGKSYTQLARGVALQWGRRRSRRIKGRGED